MASRKPDHVLKMQHELRVGSVPREDLLQAMMAVVPPGLAFRTAVRGREVRRKNSGASKTGIRLPIVAGDPVLVEVGRRSIAHGVLSSAIGKGRVEAFERNGMQYVRWGRNALWGMEERLAIVRHQQSACFTEFEDAHDCYLWWRHVAEALQLAEASKTPSERRRAI